MNYITSAIETLKDQSQSESARSFALQTLKKYYNSNIEAHKEYLQKNIYRFRYVQFGN